MLAIPAEFCSILAGVMLGPKKLNLDGMKALKQVFICQMFETQLLLQPLAFLIGSSSASYAPFSGKFSG